MRTRLLYLADLLRTSFWFVPAVLVVLATVAAFVLVALDRLAEEHLEQILDWAYTGGPEGARSVLSTIASSMITVTGVVFSITIVSLTLASSQFGPRLLRNFMRDRSNQLVLGTFIATFIYCILVLRTVRGDSNDEFVPSISVLVGVLLAFVDIAVLIYFIHHMAISIQATHVIAAVNHELRQTIAGLFPDKLGESPEDVDKSEPPHPELSEGGKPICASSSGYLLAVNNEDLMHLTQQHDLIVRLICRPGHFIIAGDTVAVAWPGERATEEVQKQLADTLQFGQERTAFQDVEFCIDQLVEIAVRSLSPGINDPFTAINCIDRLGEALCDLAERKIPSPYRHDEDGQLRVIAHPVSVDHVMDTAFNQIRQYGSSSVAVSVHLLWTLAKIAQHARREQDRAAVERHARLVKSASLADTVEEADCQDIEERFAEVLAACQAKT